MDQLDEAQNIEQLFQNGAYLKYQKNVKKQKPRIINNVQCCIDCDSELQPHRISFGICITCQEIRELKDKRYA